MFGYVYRHRNQIGGYRIIWAPAVLRHFSAYLEPMPPTAEKEEEAEEEVKANGESVVRLRKVSLGRQQPYPSM